MNLKPFIPLIFCIFMPENESLSQGSPTVLSGTYTDEITLTRENSPYMVVDSAIFDSWHFQIESGVIVTFKYYNDPEKKAYIRIKGTIATGTDWVGGTPPPAIFTSERDNDPYDLNGDSTASRPMPGDWGYIQLDPTYPEEGNYFMHSVIIRYGGGKQYDELTDPDKSPMVVISDYNSMDNYYQPRFQFLECTFEHSAGVGVQTGMSLLNKCTVRNNRYGIRMCSSDGYIQNTEISSNTVYPVCLVDPVTKRDGNEDGNQVIESFYDNIVYNNGLDVIALEGRLSCAYDANDQVISPWLFNYQLPYLITDDLYLDSVHLKIDAGTVIKFLPEAYTGRPLNLIMENSATLTTLGTEQAPVVFTSLNDHQYDIMPPKNPSLNPVPGDWGFIAGPNPNLNHTIFKYGGKYFSKTQNRVIPDSSAIVHILKSNSGEGPGTGTVKTSLFYNLYAHGIFVSEEALYTTYININNNSFFLDQNLFGIKIPAETDPVAGILNAQLNYWNGKLGPFHPVLNMPGNGCMVGDHVDFSEFLTSSGDSLLLVASVLKEEVRNFEGTPVKNALVKLNSKNPQSAYTDHNGQFFLPNVKPGDGYTLGFKAKAHRDTVIAPLNIPADTSLIFSITMKEYTIDYALDNSSFDINPEISAVSVEGTSHRYYRIVDINSREPVYGAEVLVPGLDTFYTNSAGIVDIEIPSSAVGNAGATGTFHIQRIGIETLDFPVNEREEFMVSVLPYAYNKVWSGNTYFKVGILGFEAKKERGAALDLLVKNSGSGEYADSIRMARQSRTGFGYTFGASAKVEAGPVEAGAEAGIGVNLDAIFEDDFVFDYPNPTGRVAVAKFIVLADGALPYMDAPLIRYFVACLERQVSEIEAAASTNAIGINLHAQASAEAGMDLNLLEEGTLGAELKGSASATGDITYMARLHAHKNPVTNKYPADFDFNYTGRVDLGVNASIGLDLGKLFGGGDEKKDDKKNSNAEVKKVDADLPFPVPNEDFGIDLASATASGGIKYGVHFGTTRFVPDPWCRVGFMYGYKYKLSASALILGETGISQDREIEYNFNFFDSKTIEMISQTTDLAKSMLSPDNLMKLDISDLSTGKAFNDPLNSIAYQQTRNSFSIAPVPYRKTITDKVGEGGFKIGIDIGVAVVKANFGAGFSYSEVNKYPKENGLFYNWRLYPMESYDYLAENDDFSAGPILQDIVSKSASYLVDEIKKKLIPPIFRKIKIWPFRRKAGDLRIPIGPGSRTSHVYFADSSAVITIEGIDSLDVVYWDWYGTGDSVQSSKSAVDPARKVICEYVKGLATQVHKLDYGIGGFYQFEPYNTSVGDNEVYVTINYFDDELEAMLPDSSLYMINEGDLRMYKEDKENNRWVFIGGVVDPDSNTVRARIDEFGTFTLAPFIPSGDLVLSALPDTIHLDSTHASTISSEAIFYNTNVMVADGELFTLKASRGSFPGADADPDREGFQVAASDGTITTVYETNDLSGSVTILAESLMGDASGKIELFVSDSVAPATPFLSGIEMNEEDVHLWWLKNSEPDITHYLLHYDTVSGGPYRGTATVFGDPSPVNAGLDSALSVSGLTPGKTYYFALTAIDRCGNMSGYSNELSITTEVNHRPIFYHRVIQIDPDLKNGTVIDTLLAADEDQGQTLTFYFADNNTEDAFTVDPLSGILTVSREERLDYFTARIDTFLLHVGVRDNGIIPYSDEGLVMVILDVETWVPQYRDDRPADLELYPNPAQDHITVKLGETGWSQEVSLNIYSLDGRCCFSASFNNMNSFEMEVPVRFLDQGVYHVVLETRKEKRTGKLVVVR